RCRLVHVLSLPTRRSSDLGKNLPWLKKQIFFWAVTLGLKFRLRGNTRFYRFRLGIARKLVFNKWKDALGGELRVLVSGGAALQRSEEHTSELQSRENLVCR